MVGLGEKWRPVVGFEGLYEVSDLGRMRSLGRTVICGSRWGSDRRMTFGPKIMKLTVACRSASPKGYLAVTLTRQPGTGRQHLVHHLVLESFVGSRPPRYEGAHGDGDSHNNRLMNLSWKTTKENHDDAVRHGARVKVSDGRFAKVYT